MSAEHETNTFSSVSTQSTTASDSEKETLVADATGDNETDNEAFPYYYTQIDCSTFDPSKPPKSFEYNTIGDDGYVLSLPVNLNELASDPIMDFEASAHTDHEISLSCNENRVAEFVLPETCDNTDIESCLETNQFSLQEYADRIPELTEAFEKAGKSYRDESAYPYIIETFGAPSAKAYANMALPPNGDKDYRAMMIFYEYDDFVLAFSFVDSFWSENIDNTEYYPRSIGFVTYYSKEYFKNIDPLHDWTDTPSMYEISDVAGTLAK